MSPMLADLSQAAGNLALTGIDQMIAATDIEKAGIVRSMAALGGQKQIVNGLSGKALDDKIHEYVQVVSLITVRY